MANPSRFYLSHMHAKTGYRATWDPTKLLKIGSVGKLEHGVLNVYTSLDKEGVPLEISSNNFGAAMDYTSHESVSISTKLSGAVPKIGSTLSEFDAGFTLNFRGDNGVVFQTSNHKVHQLINLAEIEDLVLAKYDKGNWDKEWVIVTELIEADAATIIISNSNNGVLELKADTSIAAQNLTLTDVKLGLSVVYEKGSSLKYLSQHSITPLYRVMGLRSAFLSNLSISNKGKPDVEVIRERLAILEYSEMEP